MVRVIAGNFKRLSLRSPRGLTTRPTADRLKETVFNLIQQEIEECRFLDCYAGSGSIGIEALSRGAQRVVFIESAPPAIQAIQANLRSLPLTLRETVSLLKKPVHIAIRMLQHQAEKFDIVFVDPPYPAVQEYAQVLGLLHHCQVLSEHARVIVEHSNHFNLPVELEGLNKSREVKQGDSRLSLYQPT